MKHSFLLLIVVATACVPQARTPAPLTFKAVATAEEYTPYLAGGTASISGQAFLMTRGGDAKKAAGRIVTLDPSTEYSREWFNGVGRLYKRYNEVPFDSLFQKARRTTTADADGRFRFTGLAPGTYLIRTLVTWETAGASRYSMDMQGGIVAAAVAVSAGEVKEVILNKMP